MFSRYAPIFTLAVFALTTTSACKRPTQSAGDTALTAPATSNQPEQLPPLNAQQLEHLRAALTKLEGAPLAARPSTALTGLMLAASGRIPPQLAQDLLDYNRAEAPEARASSLSAAIEHNIWLFDEICGQSFAAVTRTAMSLGSPAAGSHHIWRECGLDRYPLLQSEAHYVEVSKVVGLEPTIAYFVYAYLDEHGGAHPLESRLLWELARGWARVAVADRGR